MENATKALIISGSILVAILLIALGMRIFNSTQGTAESTEATMTTMAITQFNSQFTSFVGKATKAKVQALIDKVNVTNSKLESSRKIQIIPGSFTQGPPLMETSAGSRIYKVVNNNIDNYQYMNIVIEEAGYNTEGYVKIVKVYEIK